MKTNNANYTINILCRKHGNKLDFTDRLMSNIADVYSYTLLFDSSRDLYEYLKSLDNVLIFSIKNKVNQIICDFKYGTLIWYDSFTFPDGSKTYFTHAKSLYNLNRLSYIKEVRGMDICLN